jgi:hypothetical protein
VKGKRLQLILLLALLVSAPARAGTMAGATNSLHESGGSKHQFAHSVLIAGGGSPRLDRISGLVPAAGFA